MYKPEAFSPNNASQTNSVLAQRKTGVLAAD